MITFRPKQGGNHYRHVTISGRFFPAGTGTVTTGDGKVGWSITRSNTGIFSLVLDDLPPGVLVAQHATVQSTSAAALFPQFGAFTATTGTQVIRLVNGSGTATDMSASADSSVSFCLEFSGSLEDL